MTYHNNFVTSVKSNGKILREINNQVILPFQSEYSILLKNLDSRKASVSISIDGQDVLYGKSLILTPDTTLELERFVDSLNQGNKFKFIKKTQEISDHRGDKIDEGLIRVEYSFEKYKQEFPLPSIWDYRKFYPSYPIVPFAPFAPYSPFYTYCTNNPNIGCAVGNTTGTTGMSNNVIFTSSNSGGTVNCSINTKSINNKVEDGITVQGSKSEQQFNHGYIGELEESSHVIVIGLKGSDKIVTPITVKTKFQCPTCGRTSKDKFCGNCGTSLELY